MSQKLHRTKLRALVFEPPDVTYGVCPAPTFDVVPFDGGAFMKAWPGLPRDGGGGPGPAPVVGTREGIVPSTGCQARSPARSILRRALDELRAMAVPVRRPKARQRAPFLQGRRPRDASKDEPRRDALDLPSHEAGSLGPVGEGRRPDETPEGN